MTKQNKNGVNHNAAKSSRRAVKVKEIPPPSISTYTVTREDAPDARGVNNEYVPGESWKVTHAIEVRGRQDDHGGRSAWALRDIKKGERFPCSRVKIYLRHRGDVAPNTWAVQVPTMTAKAVAKSLGWEVKDRWMWVGPARAGKARGNGYFYKDSTPPDDRTAEVVFRINSSKGRVKDTNVKLFIKAVYQRGREAKCVPQFGFEAFKGISAGQEVLAYYNFIKL